MDKKYNTEFGIHIDQKSLHLLLVVFPKLVFIQELKFFISELLQELQFLTFQILLAHKVSSMLLSFLTELEEI